MSYLSVFTKKSRKSAQSGFGLIDVMLSMVLGLFLIAGLLVVLQSMKTSSLAVTGMARLQERQRNAISIISNVVRSSGYFPDPSGSTDLDSLKSSTFKLDNSAGYSQDASIHGTANTLRIRFEAPANDTANTVLNCHGESNQSNKNALYDNLFYLKNNTLFCALGTDSAAKAGTDETPLVSGVTSFTIEYGIDGSQKGFVSSYVAANNVTDWTRVLSVKIYLTFANPLAVQAGQLGAEKIVQVINL